MKPTQASDLVSLFITKAMISNSSRERFAGAVWLSLCTRFADKPLHLCCCGLPHPTSALARRKPTRLLHCPPSYLLLHIIYCLLVADPPTAARRVNSHTRHTEDTRSPLHLPEGDFASFFGGGRSLKEPHDSQWKLPATHFA